MVQDAPESPLSADADGQLRELIADLHPSRTLLAATITYYGQLLA